jgi:hypothetical protein
VEERDERFPFPPQERFSVLLFSPVSWEVSPKQTFVVEGTLDMQQETFEQRREEFNIPCIFSIVCISVLLVCFDIDIMSIVTFYQLLQYSLYMDSIIHCMLGIV